MDSKMTASFRCASFEVVVLDRDRSLFCITKPMSNDSRLDRQIDARRRAGRNVSYFCLVDDSVSRAAFVAQVTRITGCDYTVDALASR